MAYFEKRGNKWYYTIDLGKDPVTGKRRQKRAVGGTTKKEAQAAAAAVMHELAQGTHIKETDLLFPDFAQEWLQMYQDTTSVKKGTVRIRQHEINLLSQYFRHAKVKDITKKAYQHVLNDLKKREYAHNTISGAHSTGRMIFAKAMEFDMIKADPTQYAKVPRVQKTVKELEEEHEIPKYLEKEELSQFLRAARECGLEYDYTTFLTLAYSGMRAGELCALKWRDIDFEQHTISITKTYYNPSNNATQFELVTPKTKKSKRTIEMEPIVLNELEKHRASQRVFKMSMRNQYHDDDFVFTMTGKHPGYPIFIKTIENRMARLLKLSKLNEDLTPHSLRHTHTSLLAEAGVPLEDIMDRLGHQDDLTTKNVYLHVTKTRKKEASKKFGELMGNTSF